VLLLLLLLMRHNLLVRLWTAINLEPSKRSPMADRMVKDMSPLDMEKHSQLPDVPESLGG
jgi:hypothetical protein